MKIIKIISKVTLLVLFFGILILIIAMARGYRLDFKNKTLTPNGIIAVTSNPKAAKVFLNGVFKGATDINLTLPPGDYTVEVKKDGYTSWSKSLKLRGELVVAAEALLFPLNPSLSPLTNRGLIKVFPIHQSDKIIFFSNEGDATRDGLYLFDAGRNPISFFTPTRLLLLKETVASAAGEVDFSKTAMAFSPDNKSAIVTFRTLRGEIAYLLSLDEEASGLTDITASKETIMSSWEEEKAGLQAKILESYPDEIAKIATDSFHILSFSPDETKILYESVKKVDLPTGLKPPLPSTNQTGEERSLEPAALYVYDLKEDKNYRIRSLEPQPNRQLSDIQWYSDSKHLVIVENKKISVLDLDDLNKQTVYSGPFDDSFFKVAADGKIIILTNLNPEANKLPDLYAVGIR